MSKDKTPKTPVNRERGLTDKQLIAKYEVKGDMSKFHKALDKMMHTPKPKDKE